MRFLQLYGIAFIWCITGAAQSNLSFQQVVSADALQGKASCLLFSRQGFFYAATNEGLFLFNGTSLKPLSQKKDSLQKITALYEARNGVLWIGCSTGEVFFYTQQKITEWKPQEGHPQKGISDIIEDDAGQLWIATKGEGVYILSNNRVYNLNNTDGLSDDYVYDLHLCNRKIIAATDQGISICSFSGGKKAALVFNTSNGLADNIVQVIAAHGKEQNSIWLGFQNGNAGVFNISLQQYQNVFFQKQASVPVNKILPLDDEVWISDDEGIMKVGRSNLTVKESLKIAELKDLSKDAEGNIWMFTNSGLYRSAGEQLQSVFTINENQARFVNDIVVTEDGSFWLTSKGGITKYVPDGAAYRAKFIALPLNNKSDVTCIYADENNLLWIGTMGDGVFVYNTTNGKTEHLLQDQQIKNASVLSITGTRSRVWINSLEGVWYYAQDTHLLNRFQTTSATGSAYIYYVLEDSKGRVWFATDGKGISVWQNNRYISFREKEGLGARVVYSITEDKYGAIWCNTLNNGLYKYNGSKFEHFSTEQGLPDATVFSVTADDAGNVFCISAKECFLIDAVKGTVTSVAAPSQTGTININLNSSYTKGGFTWFHAGNEIYMFHQPTYKTVHAPQTKIMGMQLFLDAADTSRRTFAHNENNLSFTFNGFYYSDPSKVRYQYKLEAYNNSWQSTKDGYVNFPKLGPGTYTFKVRSSVTDNFQNASEAVYTFVINKPFWRTWWFLLLSIAAVTAVLIYIIKTREAEVQKIQQLQTEKLKSQYETLKSQVNPHFLFNSFNTLLNVIDEDPGKASVYVEHLSDFYRSIVNLREKDLIPLSEELHIIEHYFFIQKKRFGAALQFVNEVSGLQANTYSLPPLTLQLLAENAVKHNVVSKEKPLIVRMRISNHSLIVENNINPKISREKGEGLGIQNIKNRFQLIAGKEVTIVHTATDFTVTLPLIQVL